MEYRVYATYWDGIEIGPVLELKTSNLSAARDRASELISFGEAKDAYVIDSCGNTF